MGLKIVPTNKPITPLLIDLQLFNSFLHLRVKIKVLHTMPISNKLLIIPKILHILKFPYSYPLLF